MEQEKEAAFKDPTRLTNWTKWLLYGQLIVAIIAIVSGVLDIQSLLGMQEGGFESVVQAGGVNAFREGIVTCIQLPVIIITGILSLMWIYRANYNARQLGASDMKFTPGWSVGWYFIPFANLVMPYQAMHEIWKASHNPQDWQNQQRPLLLRWWWALWLLGHAVGNQAVKQSWRATGLDHLVVAKGADVLAEGLSILAIILFVRIIGTIHQQQMAHHQNGAGHAIGSDVQRSTAALGDAG